MKRSPRSIPKSTSALLPIYFTCLDHESTAASTHQNVLLSLELGLVGISYLSTNDASNFWILSIVGTALCFVLGPLYEYRMNNVDYWRNEILRLITGSPLEKIFYEGGYGSYLFGSLGRKYLPFIGHWLSIFFIPAVMLGWFATLSYLTLESTSQHKEMTRVWVLWALCEVAWFALIVFIRKRPKFHKHVGKMV